MSKPFDYSKWDNIELSDDEEDVHPNIDKESWFRMKHRSRVEREQNEEKDKQNLLQQIDKANQRIKIIQHELKKLSNKKKNDDDSDDSDDDDDDSDDREALEAELKELENANAERQAKIEIYEKNKKWNVDNMFAVKEERTMISSTAGKQTYSKDGFVVDKEKLINDNKSKTKQQQTTTTTATSKPAATTTTKEKSSTTAAKKQTESTEKSTTITTSDDEKKSSSTSTSEPVKQQQKMYPEEPIRDLGAMETYYEFTQKHAETVEEFMKCKTLEESKNFLLKYGDILLQENASNYLLLASLEDEMNGYHDKMKLTARQSQIITNIAELAKTINTHPGNVIQPFFHRLNERQHLEDFLSSVNAFVEKIQKRAITKKQEMDAQAAAEAEAEEKGTDLHDIPKEERLGPGGLDPLEVIETLPQSMVDAFESRDITQLRAALEAMDPNDAAYHMKRCVDSGLWVANNEG